MALYEKKLHIRKNGVVTDINLWTESWEAGTPALHIRDGVNLVHARLGAVTDGLASDLRVRKDNVVYAALKNRWVTINIVQSANQTITVNVDGAPHAESFAVPYGTAFTAGVTAAAGFSPGTISAASGVAEGDVTISATPAMQNLVAGSYTTVSGNDFRFTIPQGVTVIKTADYYVGVTHGVEYKVFLRSIIGEVYGGGYRDFYVINMSDTNKVFHVEQNLGAIEDGEPVAETNDGETVYWSPEINAHGPTDGSVA